MNDNKIKFAIVGAGHIGKRHAEMISRNKESELIALCDVKSQEELNTEKYNVPLYESIEELLENHPDIDVVNICTPNGLHSDQAIVAIENDKHVVVEKPIGLSKNKCEGVIFKALERHKQVFAVMQNRYSPPSVWLKDIVSNKIIGDVFMVQVNCYWNRDDRYYKKNEIMYLFENEIKFLEEISQGNVCSVLRRHLYSQGIFFGEECHYYIASDEKLSADARTIAIKNIESEELLKSLLKSKAAKVRAEVYRNLNTLEYIDKIAKDKSGEVRIVGIEALPFGSEKLKMFIEKERKSYNLRVLAKKISKKDLLFMLNKKSKSNYINLEQIMKIRLGN